MASIKSGSIGQSSGISDKRHRVTCSRCMLTLPRKFAFAGAGDYVGRWLCRHCYMQVIR